MIFNTQSKLNLFLNVLAQSKYGSINVYKDNKSIFFFKGELPGPEANIKILKEKYVEEYKHLFHYVSSIQGIIKNKTSVLNIIQSMMSGGSVIGCPKIRTLELLNKQEKEDRNIFTGSFGFIKFNEDMRFNIIIRSILNYKNISEISAPSGVVLDSSAKKEFNENFIKAKSLLELYK